MDDDLTAIRFVIESGCECGTCEKRKETARAGIDRIVEQLRTLTADLERERARAPVKAVMHFGQDVQHLRCLDTAANILERLANCYRATLASKPVRDADEALAAADHAVEAIRERSKRFDEEMARNDARKALGDNP